MENTMHNLKAYLVYGRGDSYNDAFVEVNMQGLDVLDVRKRFMGVSHKFFDSVYDFFKVGIENTHKASEQELVKKSRVIGFERKLAQAYLEKLTYAV